MAIPFFNPLADMLPDGGIYDPESGLSYTGPGATTITGQPLDRATVPTGQPSQFTQDRTNFFLTGEEPTIPDITVRPPNIIPPTLTPTVTSTVTSTSAVTAATSNRNAREFLIASLRPYFSFADDQPFLKDLERIIDDYVKQDYDVETISVLLPQTEPYKRRFAGNERLAQSGMAPLSPAEYLQAESQYNEILRRFNLGDLAKRDTFANLIGGQVSAAELTDRVVNVYDRIRNADPALRAEIDRVEALGGGLTDADFAKALLTGAEGANELKRKIATAEISAEARTRGLSTARAQELQQMGVTRATARQGFEQIRLTQPVMEKLSDIYDRGAAPATPEARTARTEQFQTELEREQFGGLASERRRRLAEQEQTAFMGQSGTAPGISLGRRRRGQI